MPQTKWWETEGAVSAKVTLPPDPNSVAPQPDPIPWWEEDHANDGAFPPPVTAPPPQPTLPGEPAPESVQQPAPLAQPVAGAEPVAGSEPPLPPPPPIPPVPVPATTEAGTPPEAAPAQPPPVQRTPAEQAAYDEATQPAPPPVTAPPIMVTQPAALNSPVAAAAPLDAAVQQGLTGLQNRLLRETETLAAQAKDERTRAIQEMADAERTRSGQLAEAAVDRRLSEAVPDPENLNPAQRMQLDRLRASLIAEAKQSVEQDIGAWVAQALTAVQQDIAGYLTQEQERIRSLDLASAVHDTLRAQLPAGFYLPGTNIERAAPVQEDTGYGEPPPSPLLPFYMPAASERQFLEGAGMPPELIDAVLPVITPLTGGVSPLAAAALSRFLLSPPPPEVFGIDRARTGADYARALERPIAAARPGQSDRFAELGHLAEQAAAYAAVQAARPIITPALEALNETISDVQGLERKYLHWDVIQEQFAGLMTFASRGIAAMGEVTPEMRKAMALADRAVADAKDHPERMTMWLSELGKAAYQDPIPVLTDLYYGAIDPVYWVGPGTVRGVAEAAQVARTRVAASALYEVLAKEAKLPKPVLRFFSDEAGALRFLPKAEQSNPELRQAIADWRSGRVFQDSKGDYHLRTGTVNRGPLAPWNAAVKGRYQDLADFGDVARGETARLQSLTFQTDRDPGLVNGMSEDVLRQEGLQLPKTVVLPTGAEGRGAAYASTSALPGNMQEGMVLYDAETAAKSPQVFRSAAEYAGFLGNRPWPDVAADLRAKGFDSVYVPESRGNLGVFIALDPKDMVLSNPRRLTQELMQQERETAAAAAELRASGGTDRLRAAFVGTFPQAVGRGDIGGAASESISERAVRLAQERLRALEELQGRPDYEEIIPRDRRGQIQTEITGLRAEIARGVGTLYPPLRVPPSAEELYREGYVQRGAELGIEPSTMGAVEGDDAILRRVFGDVGLERIPEAEKRRAIAIYRQRFGPLRQPEGVSPSNKPTFEEWYGLARVGVPPEVGTPKYAQAYEDYNDALRRGLIISRRRSVGERGQQPDMFGGPPVPVQGEVKPELLPGKPLAGKQLPLGVEGDVYIPPGLSPQDEAALVAARKRGDQRAVDRILRRGQGQLMEEAPSYQGGASGHIVQAVGPDPNDVYDFQYRVRPLDELVLSHTDALTPNPAFPQELQPRLRDKDASDLQIGHIAGNLNTSAYLKDLGILDRGVPIIGPDSLVEAGNGRLLALRRARTEELRGWNAYQQALPDALREAGIDPAVAQGIKDPVLVRERITPVADRQKFVRDANASATLGMSPLEQALSEARSLSDSAVAGLTVGENQSIDQALLSAANRPLVRSFVASLPANERASVVDANGALNVLGLTRLKAALFAKTYGGDAGQRLTQAFFESVDPSLRNIESGLMASLPAMSRAESLIATGARDAGLSLSEDLSKAVDMLARLKQNGMTAREYVAQAAMFERELTPLQEQLAVYLEDIGRSPKAVRTFIGDYAAAVEASAHPSQGTMMPVAGPTKGEILDRIIAEQGKRAEGGPSFQGLAAQEGAAAPSVGPRLEEPGARPSVESPYRRYLDETDAMTPQQRLDRARAMGSEKYGEDGAYRAAAPGRAMTAPLRKGETYRSRLEQLAATDERNLENATRAPMTGTSVPPPTEGAVSGGTLAIPLGGRQLPALMRDTETGMVRGPIEMGGRQLPPTVGERGVATAPERGLRPPLPGRGGRDIPPDVPPPDYHSPAAALQAAPDRRFWPRFPTPQAVLEYATRQTPIKGVAELIAQVPGAGRRVIDAINPAAIVEDVVDRGRVILSTLDAYSVGNTNAGMAFLRPFAKNFKVEGMRVMNVAGNPLIGDLIEHPNAYRMTVTQRDTIRLMHALVDDLTRLLRENGISVHELGMEAGDHYWPRIVKSKVFWDGFIQDTIDAAKGPGGAMKSRAVGSKPSFFKSRFHVTMADGVAHGVQYEGNPLAVLEAMASSAYRVVAEQKFAEAVRSLSRSVKDAIPTDVTTRAAQAANEVRKTQIFLQVSRRVARGERAPGATLTMLEKLYPRETAVLRWLMNNPQAFSPMRRRAAFAMLNNRISLNLAEASQRASIARAAYQDAKTAADTSLLENRVMAPAFSGRIFSREDAAKLNALLGDRANPFFGAAAAISNPVRALRASTDVSATFIQLLLMLGRNPQAWAKGVAAQFGAFAKPELLQFYLQDHAAMVQFWAEHGVHPGGSEYYAATGSLGEVTRIAQAAHRRGIPVVSGAVEGVAGVIARSGEAMNAALTVARYEYLEAMRKVAEREGGTALNQLADVANHMTGHVDTRKIGISANQRAFEGFMEFAPSYNRSAFAMMGDLMSGGMQGREALKALSGFVASGGLTYYALSEATGQEPNFDPMTIGKTPEPGKNKFLSVHWGEGESRVDVGVGGVYMALLNLTGKVAIAVSEAGKDPAAANTMNRRVTDAILAFARSRSGVWPAFAWDWGSGRDYVGEPMDYSLKGLAAYAGRGLLPFTLGGQFQENAADLSTVPISATGLNINRASLNLQVSEAGDKLVRASGFTDEKGNPITSYRSLTPGQQEQLLKAHPDFAALVAKQRLQSARRARTPEQVQTNAFYAAEGELYKAREDSLKKVYASFDKGDIGGRAFVDARREAMMKFSNGMEQIARDHPLAKVTREARADYYAGLGLPRQPITEMDTIADAYYALEPDTLDNGLPDMGRFFRDRQTMLDQLSPEQRDFLLHIYPKQRFQDPDMNRIEQQYQAALETMRPYFEAPDVVATDPDYSGVVANWRHATKQGKIEIEASKPWKDYQKAVAQTRLDLRHANPGLEPLLEKYRDLRPLAKPTPTPEPTLNKPGTKGAFEDAIAQQFTRRSGLFNPPAPGKTQGQPLYYNQLPLEQRKFIAERITEMNNAALSLFGYNVWELQGSEATALQRRYPQLFNFGPLPTPTPNPYLEQLNKPSVSRTPVAAGAP